MSRHVYAGNEPLYTERYVQWCERARVSHPPLLDNTRYFEVVVQYEDVGDVKLYLCRFPYQKQWRVFLSTDTSLSFLAMMEIYATRWTIEVFFGSCSSSVLQVVAWFLVWDRTSGQVVPKQCAEPWVNMSTNT